MTPRFTSAPLVLALVFAGCGGASEVESSRDGKRSDRSESAPAPEPEDEASPEPVPPPATTVIIVTPPGAAPAALQPAAPATIVLPASPAPVAQGDEPIPATPVDPDTWLYQSAPADGDAGAPEPGDAGFAGELRVDDLTILVIFDNSGSMDTYWEDGSRWAAANRSLVQAIEPVKTSIKAGAIRFPLDTSCGVPAFDSGSQFEFALGEDFLNAWIERALAPHGGTPLAQAFLAADEAIANAREQNLLDERFRVVLLTDGEPNCDGDIALLTELPTKWYESGVETVVLGLPGSHAAAELLDSIAQAGGTHAHQSLGTVTELDRSTTAAAR